MYQHILFPTDGSPASLLAADQCIRFAAQVGARLAILHVTPQLHLFTYEPMATEQAHDAYRHNRDESTRQALAPVEELARNAKVPFNSFAIDADEPYEAILNLARDQGCDLIAMASHGRKGIKAVILGSQTQKVLTHSALPLLVFR